jgi:UPF0271 protein
MRVVLDTSAIIYLNDFRDFEEIFTTSAVIEEVRDKISAMKVSSMNIKIFEPERKSLQEIKNVAKTTGDLDKLSNADLQVMALALEKKAAIVSDDYNIQNVAEKLGIKYVSIFNKKISKLVTWKKYCSSCERFFEGGEQCKVCGNKLIRVSEKSKNILREKRQ